MALSPLIIILVVPKIKGVRSVVALEWVLGKVLSPSDDIVNGLSGLDCFYGSLLQILICGRCSSPHYFLQNVSWQAVEKELAGFWVFC